MKKPMINVEDPPSLWRNKCPMTNERGYVLIAMTFFLVSCISLLLLASYPLVKQAKDETASYIIDRKDYRFRKALFGEVVDQDPTKLVHQGGLYSDYPEGGESGPNKPGYFCHTRVVARFFGTLGYPKKVEVPEDYKYRGGGFWAGFWGKGYLHRLPSDEWRYNTLANKSHYLFFWQPYTRIYIASACLGSGGVYRNLAKADPDNPMSVAGFKYASKSVSIELKDFSKSHSLRLIAIGSKNIKSNTFFETVDGPTEYGHYIFYKFELNVGGGHDYEIARETGQMKLMIQVKKEGSDSWITRDTRLLAISACVKGVAEGTRRYIVNFYG